MTLLLSDWWPRYHEHAILEGEDAGLVLGHLHDWTPEHEHEEHCFPGRADGGYMARYGPMKPKGMYLDLDGQRHFIQPADVEAFGQALAPYLAHARLVGRY